MCSATTRPAIDGRPAKTASRQTAAGATSAEELAAEGTRDPEGAITQAKRLIDAGSYMIMIESEGITENVKVRRTDVPARIANALGSEKVMFEAADPEVFAWYIKNYGAEVNLLSITARSFSSNACVPASGEQRVSGAGS